MEDLLHRKEKLIITAIEIIDDLGIQGLSTREIARRQGISEATLFRHYKSKNELLSAVLDFFSQFDADIFLSTKLKGHSPKEAIRFLIASSIEYYENYPAITAIMQLMNVLHHEPELSEKIKSILGNRTGLIVSLVEDAKNAGEIRADIISEDLTDIISGLIREVCLKWRIAGKNFSLKDRTLSSLEMLLDSVS